MSAIVGFWTWFAANATRLREEPDGDAVCDEITEQLVEVGEGLVGEISRTASRDHATLVVSADGNAELFPAVEAIVAEAPTVAHWEILAFRPPADPNDPGVLEMDGTKLAIADIRFVHSISEGKLELDVFVPGYVDDDETIGALCFIALDHTVGEYRMETRVGGIAWYPIEEAPSAARPLVELLALMPN
jgi:hypothetical protein